MPETPEPARLPLPRRALAYAVYLAVRAAETIVLSLPPRVAEGGARLLGAALFALDRERRLTCLENLRAAFGDSLSAAEREALARRACQHAFLVGVDAVRRPRSLHAARDYRRRIRYLRDTWGFLEEAGRGQAGILLTGHFGNWEMLASGALAEGVPISFVARSFGNAYVDRHVTAARGGPEAVILRHGAVREVRKALDRGRWGGIVGDQNAGLHGVYVDFFGLPASTYPFAATLAVREARPVYFAAAVRRGSAFAYDCVVERHREPPTGDVDEDVRRVLGAFHAFLEGLVREHPEQYFWMHRRWRTRPLGEAPNPRLPQYHHRGSRRRDPISAAGASDAAQG